MKNKTAESLVAVHTHTHILLLINKKKRGDDVCHCL